MICAYCMPSSASSIHSDAPFRNYPCLIKQSMCKLTAIDRGMVWYGLLVVMISRLMTVMTNTAVLQASTPELLSRNFPAIKLSKTLSSLPGLVGRTMEDAVVSPKSVRRVSDLAADLTKLQQREDESVRRGSVYSSRVSDRRSSSTISSNAVHPYP